jgi:hypothetical protein
MASFNVAIGIGSTILQNNIVGPPEQLEKLVQAAVSGAVQGHAAQIAELATDLRVTQAAALTIPVVSATMMFLSSACQICLSRRRRKSSPCGKH